MKPLSPHLTIYRPQLTSVLSILHRITGVLLAAGSLLVASWLIAVAIGPEAFETVHALFSSVAGQVLLFGWSWAVLYHLCNGIRHLCWDVGLGLELSATYRSGYAVIIISTLSTLLLWSTT